MKHVEAVDLVDEHGVVRLRDVPRDQVDLHVGLHMQIVVVVIINDRGEYLVHKRPRAKSVDGGAIDHVCGGIHAGETPEEAAIREALEEATVRPDHVEIVAQGINSYGRYRYLLRGRASAAPGETDPKHAVWARFMSRAELEEKRKSGELTFVGEFFEDIELALGHETREGNAEFLPTPTRESRTAS